jgi:hypothetical protein
MINRVEDETLSVIDLRREVRRLRNHVETLQARLAAAENEATAASGARNGVGIYRSARQGMAHRKEGCLRQRASGAR